jgi:hypothetical protein
MRTGASLLSSAAAAAMAWAWATSGAASQSPCTPATKARRLFWSTRHWALRALVSVTPLLAAFACA